MEYYSAMKRNKIVPFVETGMDLGTVIQSEVSQKEKKQILCNNAPMQKNDTDVLTGKAEIETQMQRSEGK